jgi:hypothetical protein
MAPIGLSRTPNIADNTRVKLDEALTKALPAHGTVLDIASGDGERVIHLARTFPDVTWQPSERNPQTVATLVELREREGLPNLLRPVELDVMLQPWTLPPLEGIVCIDSTHTTPWDHVAATFGGGARLLQPGGLFFLHGAFKFHGKYAGKELQDLDQTLRARDPTLGLRDIRELTVAGTRTGLGLEHAIATPGGHALVFRRRALLPPTGQFRVG